MKILSLKLTYFKGVKDFTLDIGGNNASIYADNAAGKSTIFDAFLWLLFGKDSQGKADFDIKTLDASGKAIPAIDHDVEGVLDVKGRRLTLKKSYKEVYKKTRGTATKNFSGHTTDHYIDDVPVSEKIYIAKIAEIADETVFKLLTSPTYFNSLKWEKRRDTILQVCGNVPDAEVINSDEKLSQLPAILQGRGLSDYRKVIKARQAKINEELGNVPTRIDEATKALPDIAGVDIREVTEKIATIKVRVKEKNAEITRIQAGGEVAEKTKALREAEGKLLDIRNKHREATEGKANKKRLELNKARDEALEIQRGMVDKQRTMKGNENLISAAEDKSAKLRQDWYDVDDQKFEFEQSDTCPACGQSLPEERLAGAREKALAAFNLNKATRLEEISKEGKAYTEKARSFMAEDVFLAETISREQERLAAAEQAVSSLKTEIDGMTGGDVATNPEYQQAVKQKEVLEQQIAGLKEGNVGQTTGIKAEIGMLETEISGLEKSLNMVDLAKKGQERIEELKTLEKLLSAEFEKLEGELYLTDLFVKAKVSLLEGKINSKFKMARFKMFNELINGGVEPCCETIYEGVPYGTNLNTGHKTMVGMDIIRTFSEHYDFTAPIFVDNAESVTELPEMNAQVIRLVKPEITDGNRQKYSKLVVEVETEKENLREAV